MAIRSRILIGTLSVILAWANAAATEPLAFVETESIPKAPPDPNDERNVPLCAGDWLEAVGPEQQLVDANWLIMSRAEAGTLRAVVAAAALGGGQCRPSGWRIFLFDADVLRGAVAVADSHGYPSVSSVGEAISVELSYHLSGDPACCPTGKANLRVELEDGRLVAH